MDSRLARALKVKYGPVAILWTDEKPAEAKQFEKGKWGCVMAAFGATADKGRVAAFDQDTFGCQGGGVGLGFGNTYEQFPGGVPGFCRFLSDGNEKSEEGRAVIEQVKPFLRGEMLEHFVHGERFVKTPELTAKFVQSVPMRQIPAKYVVFQPLKDVAEGQTPKAVVFLANPDQVSALVVMANYERGDCDGATIPWGAGCQNMCLFTYREGESERPRAVVGLHDISARRYLRRLGKDLMTVSLPWKLFVQMERNVPGSFLEDHQWQELAGE